MTTTNLGMTVPTVGADADTWGDELNADLALIDTFAGQLSTYIGGLTLSTAGSSATFACAAGVAGSTTAGLMALSSSISKTTSAWAVGTGNGALDTGAIATSTWYHVWLIKRVDTGVVDVLVSLSASSPTMPTNYTLKRRIGAMKTDGSSQWVKFVQLGNKFLWTTPVNDYNSTLGTGATLITLSVPTNVQVEALARGYVAHSVINKLALLTSPDETSAAANAVLGNVSLITQVANQGVTFGQIQLRTNTSGQIRGISDTTLDTVTIATHGWVDPRGQW